MTAEYLFKGLCAVTIIVMLIYYISRKRKIISLIFGALTGMAVLMAANRYGSVIGAEIPMNLFNTIGSAVLGVPYVICLITIKLLTNS